MRALMCWQMIRSTEHLTTGLTTVRFVTCINQSEINMVCDNQSEINMVCDNQSEISIVCDNQSEASIHLYVISCVLLTCHSWRMFSCTLRRWMLWSCWSLLSETRNKILKLKTLFSLLPCVCLPYVWPACQPIRD